MQKVLLTTFLIGAFLTSISFTQFGDAATCSGDCVSPTLGATDNGRMIVENGFVINGNSFNVESFSQTIPTQVFSQGGKVTIVLTAHENSGIINLRHVSLGIVDIVNNKEANVKSRITIERSFTGQVTHNVADPAGLLDKVTIEAKRIDSFTGSMTISFVVTKPLDTSDIAVKLWDANANSNISIFEDAIQVVGKKSTVSEGATTGGQMTSMTEEKPNPKEDKVRKKMEEQQKLKEEKVNKAIKSDKKPMTSEGKKKNKLPQQNYP